MYDKKKKGERKKGGASWSPASDPSDWPSGENLPKNFGTVEVPAGIEPATVGAAIRRSTTELRHRSNCMRKKLKYKP